MTGTEPQTVGASDNSASIPPASQAAATAGPEAGGQSHIGTTSATSATAETSGHKPFPSTLRTEDGSGTAAIGQTTTYSSRPLASGDPTPSVIDHGSRDPLTYKFPEHGHEGISGGVPAGSAAAAATQAFKNTQGESDLHRIPTLSSSVWQKSNIVRHRAHASTSVSTPLLEVELHHHLPEQLRFINIHSLFFFEALIRTDNEFIR